MYDFDKVVDRESTANIKYDLREKFFEKKDVLPMWVADMDFETPNFIRNAVKNRLEHPIYGYTFRDDGYTKSIINWVEERHNWKLEKDWIVYSPGIVPALNFSTLAFTVPGDSILVQSPVYFPFFTAATDHDRKLLNNQLVYENGRYTIDFDDFEEKAKSASMFFLSSPHNPVGRVWTYEELTRLGNICVENNVIIISDEIHNDLILPGYKHTPMASISEEIANITVTCIAPSKTFNLAGLATSSVIISNEELREKFEKIINTLHLSLGNIFGAVASQAGYNHGQNWVDELMKYVATNNSLLMEGLKDTKIKIIVPEATYLTWLDFNDYKIDDDRIKEILINVAGLGLSHGPMFGDGGQGFQRINLAAPKSIILTAIQKISDAFNF